MNYASHRVFTDDALLHVKIFPKFQLTSVV